MLGTRDRTVEDFRSESDLASRRDFCPDCGPAWAALLRVRQAPLAKLTGWGLAMIAVGIGVILFVHPGSLLGASENNETSLRSTATCVTTGTEQDFTGCDSPNARAGVAIGLFWTAIGLGMLARLALTTRSAKNSLSPTGGDGPTGSNPLIDAGFRLWAVLESVGRSSFQLQLILLGYLVSELLLKGTTPSWALVTRAIDRSLEVVASFPSL